MFIMSDISKFLKAYNDKNKYRKICHKYKYQWG